jgi:hypothetical protein
VTLDFMRPPEGSGRKGWGGRAARQVEEAKRMAAFVPVMVATIMFNTVYAQMTTVFVEQVWCRRGS